jgi:DNA repair protein RadC
MDSVAKKFTPDPQFTDAPREAKPRPYSSYTLKLIQWRWRDADDLPQQLKRSEPIRNPEDLFQNYKFLFDGLTHERFVVFLLNCQNKVVAAEICSEGTLNASLVHPREVYKAAVRGVAAAIILSHNHPSGNLEPSREDIEVTRQIVESGKILGIPCHDHVIFTENGYTSFAERGLM